MVPMTLKAYLEQELSDLGKFKLNNSACVGKNTKQNKGNRKQ